MYFSTKALLHSLSTERKDGIDPTCFSICRSNRSSCGCFPAWYCLIGKQKRKFEKLIHSIFFSKIQLNKVRIQWPDKEPLSTYSDNVTVEISKDQDTNIAYILIYTNGEVLAFSFNSF